MALLRVPPVYSLMRHIFSIVILSLLAGCSSTNMAGHSGPQAELSPHAQALQVLFVQAREDIRRIDTQNWWHDTQPRNWQVVRPFAPGTIDSTHLFEVTYMINGKTVASWLVDVRAETAHLRKGT